MRPIEKLEDNTLLVPTVSFREDCIIDGIGKITPDDPKYTDYLKEYQKQKAIELEIKEKLKDLPPNKG